MFATIDDRCGRIDVLVNNAGVAGSYGTLDSYTVEALDRLWAVNLTGPFVCAREAARRMRDSGRGGSIVNISSKAAVLGGPNEWVHYARVEGWYRHDDRRARQGARPSRHPRQRRPPRSDRERLSPYATPGRVERMVPMVPMQRVGTAEEVAAAVLWLASSAASYVTGAFIEVTGGR